MLDIHSADDILDYILPPRLVVVNVFREKSLVKKWEIICQIMD